MIAIIEYGMGNILSVVNALEALGEKPIIVQKGEDLRGVEAIILPGVGAFGDGMGHLRKRGLLDALDEAVIKNRTPFLGICLGMQFLAEKSFEEGEHDGLGWVKGSVGLLKAENEKIPHIGWSEIVVKQESLLLKDLGKEPVVYFVHSYHLDAEEKVVTATCRHGEEFHAVVEKDHIFGVQFHPEKSQMAGLKILKNFLAYVEERRKKE